MLKDYRFWLGIGQFIVVATLLLLAIVIGKVKFQANILDLLLETKYSALVNHAEQYFFEQAKSRVIISVRGEQGESAVAELAKHFKQKEWIAPRTNAFDLNTLALFYANHQAAVLSPNYRLLLNNNDSLLPLVMQKLSQAANPFVAATFDTDPSLLTADFIEHNISMLPPMQPERDWVVTNSGDEQVYLLFLLLPANASQINKAHQFATEVLDTLNMTNIKFPNAQIFYSGMTFHTAENVTKAKYEMAVFGGISVTAMILIVLLVFRSGYPLFAVIFTISNAILCGFTALVWSFNSTHVLSFVFGVTLIGIAIDYCFHGLTDLKNRISPNPNKHVLNTNVRNSLIIGFLTTSVGYLVLIGSPLDVMSQVAVFVVAGLIGALITTLFLLPATMPLRKKSSVENKPAFPNIVHDYVIHFSTYATQLAKNRKIILLVMTVGLAGINALSSLTFNDDISLLSSSSSQLLEAEVKHRKLMHQDQSIRVFIEASTIEALLQREEAFIHDLKTNANSAEVLGVSQWLPSFKQQKLNSELLLTAYQAGRFQDVNEALGVNIHFEQVNPLSPETFLNSSAKALIQDRLYQQDNGYVSLLTINHVGVQEVKSVLLQHQKYSYLLNKSEGLSQAMQVFRTQLLAWTLIASLVVLTILSIKFSLKAGVISVLILGITIVSALQVSLFIQGHLNVFNILGIILIIALAIDYLVFIQSRRLKLSNVVAITLSAISSILVFGMLIFSQTPAVFSFGLTVMLGVIGIYLLSPLAVEQGK
ncbi:MMPL family transporter [Flocculibacter collagenilyticus]|uniref:hypothetical protein n=1 Tax=Flocculibacter collagenilyticus TaxID=2744479 RepID=UPI0018F7665A|nr:hypothetical protein [Flocculibacter collagenilyticus]